MALLVSITAMLTMLAIGAGVSLTTITETMIVANHRDGVQALYAADAGIALAVRQVAVAATWDSVTTAVAAVVLVQGRFADLLGSAVIDARIDISVSASPDPEGDADVMMLVSRATGPGAIRRNVQVTLRRRLPAEPDGIPAIDTLSWRER